MSNLIFFYAIVSSYHVLLLLCMSNHYRFLSLQFALLLVHVHLSFQKEITAL